MSLESTLQELSQAHGPKALATAYGRLRGAVSASRRRDGRAFGTLAQTFIEAMRIWDIQKADGVSEAERQAGLEKTLRAAWPQTREWQYFCSCHDYGLEILTCPGNATCGRVKRHLPHEWGNPCWCQAGKRFRAPEKPQPEDFAAAGKTTKRSGLSRVGR